MWPGWDLLIIAGFSVVIYYWAYFSRLSRGEMLKIVGPESASPPEEGLAPAAGS